MPDRPPDHPSLFVPLLRRSIGEQYVAAFVTFVVVSLVNVSLENVIGYQAVALVYLLSVVIIAPFISRGPVLFVTTLTAVGWNFYFVTPRYEFNITDPYDRMMLLTYFSVTLVIAHLTAQLRAQRLAEHERAQRTSALYVLTQELAGASSLDDVFCTVIRQVGALYGAEVALLLPNDELETPMRRFSPYTASAWSPGKEEQAVVSVAYEQNHIAGRGTETLPQAEGLYLPLLAGDKPACVLALRWKSKDNLTVEQRSLLEDFARQITVVWDRQRLRDTEMHNKFLAESERLGQTLLNSISHELRTPIAAITSATSGLRHSEDLSPANDNLAREIESASARLDRVVQSLLSAARLQSGQLRPKLELCDVADLVQVTLSRIDGMMAGHPVTILISSDLPLVRVDFVLMEQVLANLFVNAAMHTPPKTPIDISARRQAEELWLEVADRGPGLPPGELEEIFKLFHRAPNARPGGTGLGLSIVRGLVEAQSGRVWAANRPGGGAVFTIQLTAKERPELPKEIL